MKPSYYTNVFWLTTVKCKVHEVRERHQMLINMIKSVKDNNLLFRTLSLPYHLFHCLRGATLTPKERGGGVILWCKGGGVILILLNKNGRGAIYLSMYVPSTILTVTESYFRHYILTCNFTIYQNSALRTFVYIKKATHFFSDL